MTALMVARESGTRGAPRGPAPRRAAVRERRGAGRAVRRRTTLPFYHHNGTSQLRPRRVSLLPVPPPRPRGLAARGPLSRARADREPVERSAASGRTLSERARRVSERLRGGWAAASDAAHLALSCR